MSLIPWSQLIGLKMNDYLFIGELIRLYLLGKNLKRGLISKNKSGWRNYINCSFHQKNDEQAPFISQKGLCYSAVSNNSNLSMTSLNKGLLPTYTSYAMPGIVLLHRVTRGPRLMGGCTTLLLHHLDHANSSVMTRGKGDQRIMHGLCMVSTAK